MRVALRGLELLPPASLPLMSGGPLWARERQASRPHGALLSADAAKAAVAAPDPYEPRFALRPDAGSRRARANFSTSFALRVFSTLAFSSHPFRAI